LSIFFNNITIIRIKTESSALDLHSILCWFYSYLSKIRPIELREVGIHEILYQILLQKYGPDAKSECMKLLLTLRKLSTSSTQIRLFSEIIGLSEKPLPPYMLPFYIQLFKVTNLHTDDLFGRINTVKLSVNTAYSFVSKLIAHIATNRHLFICKRKLALYSQVYINNDISEGLNDREKMSYMFIHDLEEGVIKIKKITLAQVFQQYSNDSKFIQKQDLMKLFKENSITPFDDNSTILQAVDTIFFNHSNDVYSYEEFDNLFHKKIRQEISFEKYLTVGADIVEKISEEIKQKLSILYKRADRDCDGILTYCEFMNLFENEKKKKQKWEMVAMHEQTKGSDGSVKYEDLLYNLLVNPNMSNFFGDS